LSTSFLLDMTRICHEIMPKTTRLAPLQVPESPDDCALATSAPKTMDEAVALIEEILRTRAARAKLAALSGGAKQLGLVAGNVTVTDRDPTKNKPGDDKKRPRSPSRLAAPTVAGKASSSSGSTAWTRASAAASTSIATAPTRRRKPGSTPPRPKKCLRLF
jgi:hypothetical protein